MECNRDEALRAKEVAERKFIAKDIKGALKFALKAQSLHRGLEGISQMVRTFEVYTCLEEGKVRGEANWYGVLGVTRLADDETIRKQYRALALLLHPDKNRSVGAEGAFTLVSQAWSLLSDRAKRLAYDQRCDSVFQQKVQMKNASSAKPPKQNGFNNVSKSAASRAKTAKGNASKKDAPPGPCPAPEHERPTFWTVCHQCKVQYEYLRMYLNRNLLCPNCQEAYFAIEIVPPSKGIKSSQTNNLQNRKNAKHGSSSNNQQSSNPHWAPFSGSGSAASAVHAANMVKQAYDKVKRQRQKVQAVTRREEASHGRNPASNGPNAAKRRKMAEDLGKRREAPAWMNSGNGVDHKEKVSGLKEACLRGCTTSEGECDFHLKQLLAEKAREEICKKLNENCSTTVEKNKIADLFHQNIKEPEKEDKDDPNISRGDGSNQDSTTRSNKGSEKVEQMYADVLEPDFCNFDKNRLVTCFRENQVWAVYDDDDGMPRHYAMIQNLISLDPFEVRMCWLRPTASSTFRPVSWVTGSYSKSCGEFQKGTPVVCNSIDCFSHNVKLRDCSSKFIRILPVKGDVWALYRNWSAEWNELTENDTICKYEMVEVLEDYDEELGVLVVPLIKVAGTKSVFRMHFDSKQLRRIPKEEIYRFSHQVPSHLITGHEGLKYLKGCWELDPAATPLEILEAASKTEETEFMETEFLKTESMELDYPDNPSGICEAASTIEEAGLTETKSVRAGVCDILNAGDTDCQMKNTFTAGIVMSRINEVIDLDND